MNTPYESWGKHELSEELAFQREFQRELFRKVSSANEKGDLESVVNYIELHDETSYIADHIEATITTREMNTPVLRLRGLVYKPREESA